MTSPGKDPDSGETCITHVRPDPVGDLSGEERDFPSEESLDLLGSTV